MNTTQLLQKITLPFTSIEYYKSTIHKSFASSAVTVLSVIFLLSFFSGFIFIQQSYPGIISTIKTTIDDVSNHYPEDLLINWNGSKLTANRDVVEVPWKDDFSTENQDFPNKFLYYSNSTQSPEELNIGVTESLFFVNQSTLYHSSDNNPSNWMSQPLQNILTPDLTLSINKEVVTQTTTSAQEFITSNNSKISLLFFSTYSLIFVISKLLFLLIETVLVVLLFKLYSIKLQTKQAILLSMHIMIPTVIVNTLAEILYTNVSIPLQTITFWILIILVSSQFKNQPKKTV